MRRIKKKVRWTFFPPNRPTATLRDGGARGPVDLGLAPTEADFRRPRRTLADARVLGALALDILHARDGGEWRPVDAVL